ncbi:MAG TPA: hypothetical protein VF933_22660 [Streptosporangiaceae bacterium]
MTKHERSSRPDRLSVGRSADPVLDALLDGRPLPDGEDPARWQPVAEVLTALTSAPERSELTGEARALAEFRSRACGAPRPARASRRSRGWAASLRVPRPAVAAATGAVAMGGLLAVAYAGDLPAAAQRLAHDTIGAPAAARDGGPGSRPPASPGPASPRGSRAGQAGSPSGHGPGQGDRRIARGHPSGSPYRHWPASSAPGTAGGGPSGSSGQYSPGQYSPGQPGTPGGSPTPGPTQQPSPWASSSPSAGAAPSPTASPSTSQQSRHHDEPVPAATQSFSP